MPRVLVSGSVSYDTLLRIDDDFCNTMRRDAGSLSVGYHCTERYETFGGNAANISYHLARQGIEALPVAAVGYDFGKYADWMDSSNVDRSLLLHVNSEPTARVYIMSDSHENQILTLHLGSMKHSSEIQLAGERADVAVVGPDDRDAFMRRVEDFDQIGAPILLDPGQCITSLSSSDLIHALSKSRWLVVNEFECSFLESLTGATSLKNSDLLDALVVTKGAQGCRIYCNGGATDIDAVAPTAIIDPTGCGDTFRAGFISGILSGIPLIEAAKLGITLAADTMAHLGAQWQLVSR